MLCDLMTHDSFVNLYGIYTEFRQGTGATFMCVLKLINIPTFLLFNFGH